jgi:hypothetical protein
MRSTVLNPFRLSPAERYAPHICSHGKLEANYGLSRETIFLGRSNVDEERGFTGVSSFLWDRKVLSQAAHFYLPQNAFCTQQENILV